MNYLRHILLMVGLLLGAAHGAEYFVATQGDDTHDGTTRETAFATVQRGVDALAPGDTLTILPGSYYGSTRRKGIGSDEADTVIRAETPGTVLLRGDVSAPAFRKLEGFRHIYVAEVDIPEAQAVNEVDTLQILQQKPALAELEFAPGTFHHDVEGGRLYVSTSDFQPPSAHHYTISTALDHGIWLGEARRVIIEGLAVTGFNVAATRDRHDFTLYGTWGIFIANGRGCVIRNCQAYLNAHGIGFNSMAADAGDNTIVGCEAWANSSYFGVGDRGGLTLIDPRRDTIRDSVAYLNAFYGVNIRGGGQEGNDRANQSFLIDNLAWGNGAADIKVKTGFANVHVTERCIAPVGSNAQNMTRCLFDQPAHGEPYASIVGPFEWETEFADPANHDYRLQATSQFRGAGPDGSDLGPNPYEPTIFYVKPDGDDAADGLSVEHAWQTLARATRELPPGSTLYILPGTYANGLQVSGLQDVAIRGRGTEAPVLQGNSQITDSQKLELTRLDFAGELQVQGGRDIAITHCRFEGRLLADGSEAFSVRHCRFSSRQKLVAADDATLAANDFSTGQRQFDLLGRPYGPYRMTYPKQELKLIGSPEVYSVTTTTANLEWFTAFPAVCEIAWGPTPACEETAEFEVNHYGSYSLTGLQPSTTYYFQVRALRIPRDVDNPLGLEPVTLEMEPIAFTTAATDREPRYWYVATDGDDAASGESRETAWRTLQHAANAVRPGDTVWIAEGTYSESIRPRSTGTPEAPITFRCLPGERVAITGAGRSLNKGFHLTGKHHFRFDGFYFRDNNREKLQGWHLEFSGEFLLYRCRDIVISRCFSDGRGTYSSRFVTAHEVEDLTIRNSVTLNKFSGLYFRGCPNLLMERVVFARPMIACFILRNDADQPATLRHCILTDMLLKKAKQNIWLMVCDWRLGCPRMENCGFFIRLFTPETRRITQNRTAPELTEYMPDPLFGDPQFAGVPEDAEGFAVEAMMNQRLDLDFHSFFATNPEYVSRGIGLDPEAFADFDFTTSDEAAAE